MPDCDSAADEGGKYKHNDHNGRCRKVWQGDVPGFPCLSGWRAALCFEVIEYFVKGLVTTSQVFLQAAHNDARQIGWQLGVQQSRVPGHGLNTAEHQLERVALEGQIPRDHLVQHQAEGIDIATAVDLGTLNLLWRHIARSAQHLADGGHRRGCERVRLQRL